MDDSLERFVHDALARGVSRAEVETVLADAGWARDEIDSALARWADTDFPVPVPRPKPYVSAREAFIYLVLFTLLYLSAWSLGALLFQLIDRGIPDPARSYGIRASGLTAIRWAVAMLVIAFPGYLLLSWRTYRVTRLETERRKSRVRKWLTYLTLFLAASVLLGDLISLVFNLLEGELTVRFLLKVLTVAGIAGAIFGYYLWDLRQDDAVPETLPARRPLLRALVATVTLVVVVSLLWGLWIAGSPGRARVRALDGQREGDLASIANAIDLFWNQHEELPGSLEELRGTRGVYLTSIEDPASGERYEYLPTDAESYELCARFDAASTEEDVAAGLGAYPARSKFWQHGAGRACFSVAVQTD